MKGCLLAFNVFFLLVSCGDPYSQVLRTSYILGFYEIDSIASSGELINIEEQNYAKIDIYAPTVTMVSDIFRKAALDADKRLFNSLCQKYGDTDYPQVETLYFKPSMGAKVLGSSFPSKRLSSLDIYSNGAIINDKTYFVGVSIFPYIRQSYKKCHYEGYPFSPFFNYELQSTSDEIGDLNRPWYPIDKRVDRLTEDDICLFGHGFFSKPGGSGYETPDYVVYHTPTVFPNQYNIDNFYYNLFSLFVPIEESAGEPHSYEIRVKDEDGTVFTTKVVL